MSTSSEDSLATLPLPYDISSAVSRALRIDSTSSGSGDPPCEAVSSSLPQDARPFSDQPVLSYHPPNYLTAHDPSVHGTNGAQVDGRYQCASFCYPANSHYMQFNQPYHTNHHYSSIVHPPPPPPDIQMQMEAWTENTTLSICNSSEELLNSELNIDQLDQFCRYIDSSGDEDLLAEDSCQVLLQSKDVSNHRCYSLTGDLTSGPEDSSPPRKKRRNTTCVPGYYNDDNGSDESATEEDLYYAMVSKSRSMLWRMELDNQSMWQEFDSVGTEMVITKAGRRMFPTLSANAFGLDRGSSYSVKLEIAPSDNKRYKYLQTEWVAVGRSDKKPAFCEYEHPDSPNSGGFWMDKTIAFKMVKLTNNKNNKSVDQMVLNSMHKYQPCLKITCERDGSTRTFCFPETKFIAVTAYQSTGITQLKINNNPYARAFRESVPSDSSKMGGHYRHISSSRGVSPSPSHASQCGSGHSSQVPSPKPRPITPKPSQQQETKESSSSTSVESGFESSSDSNTERPLVSLKTETSPGFSENLNVIITHPNPYSTSSLMTYWADDNSLWNPHLITPDPLLDSTSSFSEPFLQQSSRLDLDYDVSPVKFSATPVLSYREPSLLDLNKTVIVDHESVDIDDDVFF